MLAAKRKAIDSTCSSLRHLQVQHVGSHCRGVVGLIISNFLDISGPYWRLPWFSIWPCQAVKDDESGSARFEASEVPYLPK